MRTSSPRIISIDTETYGACERDLRGRRLPPQTVFHPRKAVHTDGCHPSCLVLTVQVTVPEADPRPEPSRPWNTHLLRQLRPGRTFVLHPSRPSHLRTLLRWLAHADTLLGMNLPFDVQFLRTLPGVASVLPRRRHTLIDVSVLNYLDSEVRPEKSLKDMGPLFGAFRYERTLRDSRFPSPLDPAFLEYAAADPHNTMLMASVLADNIITAQPNSAKNLPAVLSHYSSSLWTAIEMAETGIPYSVSRLTTLRDRLLIACSLAERMALARGLLLQGKGSDRSKRDLASSIAETVQPHLLPEEQITLTEKTREIQWTDANRALFLKYLPKDHPSCLPLRWASVHSRSQKLLSTYVWPLLHGRRNDPSDRTSRLVPCPGGDPDVHIAHPSFYVTPGPVKGGSGSEGGTIQARVTCKSPAAQTDPPQIEACRRSRYPGGRLLSFDLRQIELRVPAVLTGEPTLVDAFVRGVDLHTDRTLRMFGESVLSDPLFKSLYRQAGKTVNFADAFWATAARMQQTVYEDTGVLLPLEFFEAAVRDRPTVRPVMYRWQANLIEGVRRDPVLRLPVLGLSRSFHGKVNDHINEILNFPVQTWAALVMQDLHDAVLRRLPSGAGAYLQIYDSASFDCHPRSLPKVRSAVSDALDWVSSRGLWARFCAEYGTTVPLELEIKESA